MRAKLIAALIMTAMSVFLLSGSAYDKLGDKARADIEASRMKNVSFSELPDAAPETDACFAESVSPPEDEDVPLILSAQDSGDVLVSEPVIIDSRADEVLETTISGGMTVNNLTGYVLDAAAMTLAGPGLALPADSPQILIIHTHSSEAYTPAGLDRYEPSDSFRTEDAEYNIIRVGDELTSLFQASGLNVIHDRNVYDYPSYTGSYSRSGQAIEEYLHEYPGLSVVLDVHRDALGSGDVVYKTMAEESCACASQVMLLVGTDESGLEHPHWRRNLALALYLQKAVDDRYPTLMRPIELVQQRYNQHLTTGSLIVEVGSNGNTLQEALAAARLFASAAAPALSALVEQAGVSE